MKKALLLLFLFCTCALLCCACQEQDNPFLCEFDAVQVNAEQQFRLTWTDDSVTKLEVTVMHGTQTVTSQALQGDALRDKAVILDAYYGKHTVNITATNAEGAVCRSSREVTLQNSEYIIAPISGSMPQLYFTLNIKEITKEGTLPAFVWLCRPDSWNWDNLPVNVFPMPNVEKSEILTHNNYDRMVEATNSYIKELYAINANAKFHLYINDFNSYLYLKLLVANGIPESNFTVTLLSDGGASYAAFNAAFDSEDESFDADAKYGQMVADLQALYTEVASRGDYIADDLSYTVDTYTFNQYAYVASREKDNVEWWILRPRAGVLCSPDEEFINRVLNEDKIEGIIEERNFASPLNAMSDGEKAELKALYNFNNEMFAEAEQSGKRAMMILGSWATAENEPDFEAYVRFVKAYYGDDFVYYYKGHPNTPTANYPEKQAQLEALGLIDVESSINAELILFFYPDIYMCGYNSSTFLSVQSPEMACAMFNMKKEDCTADYSDLLGIYVSKLDTAQFAYPALCPDADHSYFLIEYNNQEDGTAFGIYDDTDGSIRNYTVTNGTPTEK